MTPAVTGDYKFSTCADIPCASTVDDIVTAIYTSAGGCAGPFTQIGCDDDSCTSENFQSSVSATLEALL